MKSESGKSIIILIIMAIVIIIGATYAINYAKQMMAENKEQDLKTNMLLIQAEVKKGLEEVCFRTVNMNSAKQEDLTKINQIKSDFLDGIILQDAPQEVQEETKNVLDFNFEENCYYLNEQKLNEIGIENVNEKENGYFIVKYDFSNAGVEVINTKGFDGKYTLTQIMQDVETHRSNTLER